MALAVALDEVRSRRVRREMEGGALRRTPFIESDPQSPQAFLVEYDPNRVSRAHFHEVDQFQIIVDGSGMLGRHALRPYSVHFARAHTPYGPLVAAAEGMTFVTLRWRFDAGAQRMPEAKARLDEIVDRRPWQVTQPVTFDADRGEVVVEPIPGMKDEQGLAGYSVTLAPNAMAHAPDPARGAGQYLVVLEGSLVHEGKEHKGITVVSIEPHEGSFRLLAGSRGLKGFVLTFPREGVKQAAAPAPHAGYKIWQCVLCAFTYDEEAGLPEEGIAAGTRWQDVPDTWTCPDCTAIKSEFQVVEL